MFGRFYKTRKICADEIEGLDIAYNNSRNPDHSQTVMFNGREENREILELLVRGYNTLITRKKYLNEYVNLEEITRIFISFKDKNREDIVIFFNEETKYAEVTLELDQSIISFGKLNARKFYENLSEIKNILDNRYVLDMKGKNDIKMVDVIDLSLKDASKKILEKFEGTNGDTLRYQSKVYLWDDTEKEKIEQLLYNGIHSMDKVAYDVLTSLDMVPYKMVSKGDSKWNVYESYVGEEVLIRENIKTILGNWEVNKPFILKETDEGNHHLGGKLEEGLTRPEHSEMHSQFQYVGSIDGEEEVYKWLGVERLHLFYPLYECVSGVTLDYADPLSPEVIQLKDHSDAWNSNNHMNDIYDFPEVRFQYREDFRLYLNNKDSIIGGIPLCFHDDGRTPICPKCHSLMKFVAMIPSHPKTTLKSISGWNNSIIFGDAHELHVFWCNKCRVLEAYV